MSTAFCKSVIKMSSFSLHDSAARTDDQSLFVSQRPKVRHALSLCSRIFTFRVWSVQVLLVIGLVKTVKWSLFAIFGSCKNCENPVKNIRVSSIKTDHLLEVVGLSQVVLLG